MKLKWKSARLADRNQRSVGTRQIICNVEILERRRLLSNTAVQNLFVVNIFAGSIGKYTTSGTTVNASLITGLDDPQSLCIATDQTVGPATQLAFGPPPTNITAGNVITPAISADVEDANGDIVIGDQSNVTISIASGPAGARLDGTTTVAARNGIATFSDLSIRCCRSAFGEMRDKPFLRLTETS